MPASIWLSSWRFKEIISIRLFLIIHAGRRLFDPLISKIFSWARKQKKILGTKIKSASGTLVLL